MKKYELRLTECHGDSEETLSTIRELRLEFFEGKAEGSPLQLTFRDAKSGLNAPLEFPHGTYEEVRRTLEEIMTICDPSKIHRILQKIMGVLMLLK